jgi:uncharacterized OB-fold protein
MNANPHPKPVPVVHEMNAAFFEGSAKGELRVGHCPKCDALFRFAYYACPECWSQELSWKKANGTGKISHFTIIHQAPWEAFEADAPYVLALIELDEGVRMMSNIINYPCEQVKIGLPVRVTFEQRGDVALPMFEVVEG